MKENLKYKKVSLQSNNLKDTKKYVKILQDELDQSKIAVENITTFKFMEQELRKKIQFIQSELHNCMLKINSETKKQKVLEDLISLMKGEEFNFQNKLKNQDQIANINLQKQIHRIENDIEQILQNHNEQVAKINILKQQASSFRSERVVYSNLFKKLEKEIQHYEQIYKFELLKTQTTKRKCRQNEIPNASMLKTIDSKAHSANAFFDQKAKSINFNKIEEKFQQKQLQTTVPNLFITSTKQSNTHKAKKLGNGSSLESKLDVNPKSVSNRILIHEQQLKKIKVYGGCDSLEELIEHYETLEFQNKELIELIQETNCLIHQKKSANQKIQRQLYETSKYSQNYIEKVKFQDQLKDKNEGNDLPGNRINLDIMVEMMKILNACGENNENINTESCIDQQILAKIFRKIQGLTFDENRDMIHKNRQQTGISETFVDTLLERMDILQNCQKIMDKVTFQEQYHKEISKGKKNIKLKKI